MLQNNNIFKPETPIYLMADPVQNTEESPTTKKVSKPKVTKSNYSLKIGLLKTAKNGAIFWAPAILGALIAIQTQLPISWTAGVAIVISLLSYFVKNYVENK